MRTRIIAVVGIFLAVALGLVAPGAAQAAPKARAIAASDTYTWYNAPDCQWTRLEYEHVQIRFHDNGTSRQMDAMSYSGTTNVQYLNIEEVNSAGSVLSNLNRDVNAPVGSWYYGQPFFRDTSLIKGVVGLRDDGGYWCFTSVTLQGK